MRKDEFLAALGGELQGLPTRERDDRLAFYGEAIDDRIEEGLSEEAAVADMGSVAEVVAQILSETPLLRLAKEKIKPKRKLKGWEIALLAVGSPVWGALLVSAVAAVFSVYVSLWAAAVSLWSAFASFAACAPVGVVVGCVYAFGGNLYAGLALAAASLVCAALAIFSFFGCRAATRGLVWLTKKAVLSVKRALVRRKDDE